VKYLFLTGNELRPYYPQLARFEAQFRYPLGDGRFFRISHGEDYGAFFRSFGAPRYILVLDDEGEVAAFTAGVRRPIRRRNGSVQEMWYLCDFKIAKPYRGGRTFIGMGSRMLPRFYRFWLGAYFVGMNNRPLSELLAADGLQVGGIATLIPLRRFPAFKPVSLQAIYFAPPLPGTVTGDEVNREVLGPEAWRLTVQEPEGRYVLTCLRGVKDLLIEPTGEPMRLLHVGAFDLAPEGDPAKYLLGLLHSARIRAGEWGAETVCFCWDAHDRPMIEALADAGMVTESSGTTYDLYPPGVKRIPLPIQTAEI
jgi:hypothetical protein